MVAVAVPQDAGEAQVRIIEELGAFAEGGEDRRKAWREWVGKFGLDRDWLEDQIADAVAERADRAAREQTVIKPLAEPPKPLFELLGLPEPEGEEEEDDIVEEEVEPQAEAPVLDLGKPLEIAEAFLAHIGDGLRWWQGTWWAYNGKAWEEQTWDTVENGVVYKLLKGSVCWKGRSPVAVDPNQKLVGGVMDAMQAAAFLSPKVEFPGWVGTEAPVEDLRQLVAVENGLLYLPTREFRGHTQEFWSPNVLDFEYDAEASCPRWMQFLEEVWPGDGEVHEALQEIFGLVLTDVTRCQKMFMFVGPPRGGRGTIGRVLAGLIGKANVVGATFSVFADRFGLQPWIGKKLAIFGDATVEGVRGKELGLIVERLKLITGEDSLPIDRKNKEQYVGPLGARIITFSNEPLQFTDHSGALAQRLVTIEMTKSFGGNPDRLLTEKLLAERAGIFNWALDGLDRLREREWQFVQPRSGEALAEQLLKLSSHVRAFVDDECEGCDTTTASKIDSLYLSYRPWCESQKLWPGTKEQFAAALRVVTGLHVGRPRKVDGEHNDGRGTAIYGLRLRPKKPFKDRRL